MKESAMTVWKERMKMSKWIEADAFNRKVDEAEAKLNKRWDEVHKDDMETGFFHCLDRDDPDDERYIGRTMKVRVCDGCGDDLYPTGSVCEDFHCSECEFWYSGISGGHLKPPSMWGNDTGESFDDEGKLI